MFVPEFEGQTGKQEEKVHRQDTYPGGLTSEIFEIMREGLLILITGRPGGGGSGRLCFSIKIV